MRTQNKIYPLKDRIAPSKAHADDAAIDLFIQNDTVIPPHTSAYLAAGATLDLKPGYAGLVFSRSSAPKNGAIVPLTMIDPGYKGEFSTIAVNYTSEPLELKKGDRLGQLMLVPYFQFENEEEEGILKNNKGNRDPNAKFGSSGKNIIN